MVSSTSRSSAPATSLAVFAALAALGAGCDGRVDTTGRLLELAPAEAEVVVAIDPAQVAGTWLDRTVTALVEGPVPACVLEAARSSPLVVVAWAADAGVLIAIAGRRGEVCDDLLRRGDDRIWVAGLEPGEGHDRFFAERERRRRWSSLPAAPVRAIADLQLSAGVVVHGRATADPRDGLDARLIVATDDRATLLSLRERYLRWRGGLDHDRLGAAWPALAAMITAEDRGDPDRPTDVVEVRLPGEDGATAAALAVSALAAGLGGVDPRLPCPDSLGDYGDGAICQDGEFTLNQDVFDELIADPSVLMAGVRIVPAHAAGRFVGIRLEAMSATDPLTWLGFVNGDTVEAIDGQPLSSPDQMMDLFRALMTARETEIGVLRRGHRGVLRYRVR